ncbi:MAG: extracellular solute-binding protein [Oscillospiraceae bacterium]|nr:extracellular solute-binding protein [Oscillospiraceae bacterium]
MNIKRFLAAVLLLVFILQIFMACGEEKNNPNISGGGISGNEETEEVSDPNARINKKDNLPADLDFGGKEIRILLRTEFSTDFPEKSTGDVVNDAVFEKNIRVQERLNCKFKYGWLTRGGDWSGSLEDLKNVFLSGDDLYDLVSMTLNICTFGSLMTVFFMDLQHMPYIDLDQPWWNKTSTMELSHDGKIINYLIGDASVTSIGVTTCIFYNKNMYNDYYGDPDALYKVALDGIWTLDYLGEKCKDMYVDLNGDGVADGEDQYGMTFEWWTFYNIICGSTDARMSSRDSDGYIQIDMDLNRLLTFTEKMYDLCYNNIGVDYYGTGGPTLAPLFLNRQMAFYPNSLSGASSFRAMEDDYGILPQAKLDENQKEYRSLIMTHVVPLSIPKTCKIPETVCAVMEALAAEGYRTVTEIYYEVALKTKYSRDEYSGQVIDLIHSTSYNDFMNAYIAHTANAAFIVFNVVNTKSTDLMSFYTKSEDQYKNLLDKLIESLTTGVV